ncbi:polysaccharide deacetylase family protein [Haloimpatiens sp. FM7330]|uniref:polysaccharide deacetylase family protein n=1 Tax=Haloimpatiens sp. FM7330 TaxID=3298610 RepID=UPI0036369298
MLLKNSHKSNLSSSVILKYPTKSKKIALTYDCGGKGKGATLEILNVLKKHNIKATFFITGQWAECYPWLVKKIVDENHEIGNHSYSHRDFTKLTRDEIIKEVTITERLIKNITNISPKPLIRCPYGSFNNEVLKILGLMGYKYTIQWTIDPRDWELPPSDVIVDRILSSIVNGSIILMHNHSQATASACNTFIPKLKKHDFKFITISKITNYIRTTKKKSIYR